MNMDVCERSSCVYGHHIYKDIWDAIIGEELQCEREPDTNRSDRYAVTVTSNLPHKYHEPVLRTGIEVTCLVIVCGSNDSRQLTIRVWKFPSLDSSNDNCAMLLEEQA